MNDEIVKAKFALNYRYSIQQDPDTGVLTCLPEYEYREICTNDTIARSEIKFLARYFKRQYALKNDIDFEDVHCVVKLEKTEYVVENYEED